MKAWRGKGVRVLLDVVRDREDRPPAGEPVRAAVDVVRAWRILRDAGRLPQDREAYVVLMLDARHRVIGFHVVAVGSLNTCPIHPREVFRAAVVIGAAAVVTAHNHPSGDPSPSPEDQAVTRRLADVGELLGIQVLDDVVIGAERYYSAADGRHYPIEDQ